MHVLQMMDRSGHTNLEFDPKNDASVKAAMDKFAELVGEGWGAAKEVAPGQLQKVKAFDPTLPKTVMHPHLVGG